MYNIYLFFCIIITGANVFSLAGSGDMSASFLAVLVSSVENYKLLQQQSKHFKEVRL